MIICVYRDMLIGRMFKKMPEAVKKILKRYFVDAMSAMALGLFASLIIGLIISQLAKLPFLSFMAPFSEVLAATSPVVGGAIGAAVAWGLGATPLCIFSSVATGAFGYMAGGPVGAYVGAVLGAEVGRLVAGRTKVDIVLTPLVTIVAGCLAGAFVGPYISRFMESFGGVINASTELSPFPMGIAVSVLVGLALTAPISSAAICIMLGLDGLAAGAATVGCCAQMVGFAVASYRDNGPGGLLSQGIGTSMLQFPNIVKNPRIWIAPTLAAAVLGPVASCVVGMKNTSLGAGMGTSGLVGQFGTLAAMEGEMPLGILILVMLLLHFVCPALLTLWFDSILRKWKWVKKGDMKITH